ncbi:hypothetical protein SSX86_017707 [Deinandra increscens subsp. villosa]|uniref:Transmembrane 9 superfamily member n=1 Tax=Deinandra increscens subsp. villosa TaxID=3103831 RepID=A0AAP0CVN7_9ASTR
MDSNSSDSSLDHETIDGIECSNPIRDSFNHSSEDNHCPSIVMANEDTILPLSTLVKSNNLYVFQSADIPGIHHEESVCSNFYDAPYGTRYRIPSVPADFKPKLDSKFDSWENAYAFYEAYAEQAEFSTKLRQRMVGLPKIHFITFLLIFHGSQVESDASNHSYTKGDTVPFYANKVASFGNPRETYAYYDLPFCSPDIMKKKKLNLGEMLNGDYLVSTPFKLEYLVDKHSEMLCKKRLSKTDVSQFRSAIDKDYYVEYYYDDLPVWAYIGWVKRDNTNETIKNHYFLYTRYDFNILYNNSRVIEAAITASFPKYLDVEVDVDFTYNVRWSVTNKSFDARMDAYTSLDHHSFTNSSLTLLILMVCLLTLYMKTIRKDISKYERYYQDVEENEVADNQEETGGKNIHGDVFRYPKHKSLFAAALGSGTHLLVLIVSILVLGLLASPLLLLGGIIGKNRSSDFQAPCRTAKCPKDVPQLRWYRGVLPKMGLAGILPFSVIYVQLYYIFTTVWGHRVYTFYTILFVVFVLLLIMTALVSVALTYFQLAVEDHEWWWRSFFCGGSTGLFIYGYCIYYYFWRSDITGFMQTSFFFGYMACVSYGMFLTLGSVGFRASLLFVRCLYASRKCD